MNGNKGNGGGKPADTSGSERWWERVPPILPGQAVFSPKQIRLLLGGISESTYYELRACGRLKFSRVDRGRQVVHTREQYLEFVELLNSEVNGGVKLRRVS